MGRHQVRWRMPLEEHSQEWLCHRKRIRGREKGTLMKTAYNGLAVPSDGKAIGYEGGALRVPDNPIIPFIEGDGTGRDIWKASRRVFDAAVEKAYGGKRRVGWVCV